MSQERVICRNWIVDLGRDPVAAPVLAELPLSAEQSRRGDSPPGDFPSSADWAERRAREVADAVSVALRHLAPDERDLIERLYFMGEGFREQAEETGKAIYRLEGLHLRAVRKLRRRLAAFVQRQYGVRSHRVSERAACPLCDSPERAEIDVLIRSRDPKSTWGQTIEIIYERYGIKIVSPQTLIGHLKYHS